MQILVKSLVSMYNLMLKCWRYSISGYVYLKDNLVAYAQVDCCPIRPRNLQIVSIFIRNHLSFYRNGDSSETF